MALLALSKGDSKPFPGFSHGRKVSQDIKNGLGIGPKSDKKGLPTNLGGPRLRATKSTPTLQAKDASNSSTDLLKVTDPLSAESSKTFSFLSASSTSRSTTPQLNTKKSNRTLNMEQWVDPLGPGSSPYDVILRPGQPQPRRRLRNASSRPRLRTGPPSTRTPSLYSITPSGLQVPLPPARPGMGPRGISAPHLPHYAPEATLLDTDQALLNQRSLSAQGPFPNSPASSSIGVASGFPPEDCVAKGSAVSGPQTDGLGLVNTSKPLDANKSLDVNKSLDSNKFGEAPNKSLDSYKSVDTPKTPVDAPNTSIGGFSKSIDAPNKSLEGRPFVGAPFKVDFDPPLSTTSSEFASTNPAPSFVTAASPKNPPGDIPVSNAKQLPRAPAKDPSIHSQSTTTPVASLNVSPVVMKAQPGPVNSARATPNLSKELPPTATTVAAPPTVTAPPTATAPPVKPLPPVKLPQATMTNPLSHTWPQDENDIHKRYVAAFATKDSSLHIRWALETFRYAERKHDGAPISTPGAAWTFNEHPVLQSLFAQAVDTILRVASMRKKPEYGLSPDTVCIALYLRGDLGRSGCSPEKWPLDERRSFRDFEAAANTGLHAAWFRIGRAYEEHGDTDRAVHAYTIGIERGRDPSCLYRLGMAHLLGQLSVHLDGRLAFEFLRQSADNATTDAPQSPYILGLLLAGEFEVAKRSNGPSESQVQASILEAVKAGLATLCANPMDHVKTAYSLIERSAALLFGPAQLRLGQAFEFGNLTCSFNPSLSLRYYLRASENGQADADMALSKWFLCGSEGHFEKSEQLAVSYARRAAARGLHSASFALGYFYEVGIIDNQPNLALAASWYRQAIAQGNPDSQERLDSILALEKNDPPPAPAYQSHVSVAAECLGSSLLADWTDTPVN